jgi:methylated-DNA-[protein]-cysteine S-methyltransferase
LNLAIHRFSSPLGAINTISYKGELWVVSLPNFSEQWTRELASRLTGESKFESGGALNLEAERQFQSYFRGELTEFDLPLHLSGTMLQKKILAEVARIPYGHTSSYGEIAALVGHAKAVRSVGSCMARNPLPFVIPCHRVVASNGPGGYGGGLEMKMKLLAMEQNRLMSNSKNH